jgi:Fe-S cluster assembly scaffold protein SufB
VGVVRSGAEIGCGDEHKLVAGSVLLISERVMTEGRQVAKSRNEIELAGTDSKSNIVSRSVL